MEVALDDILVVPGLGAQIRFQLMALAAVAESFDGLLEADSEEEADGDGGDVDDEVLPGVDGLVRGVDVELSLIHI